ncbi:Uncharacterized protein APZ42_016737 [Daphnia magna]|uniref:Uncharacterized protein n=1 Tax=Daphnia magna TaxID=35525 RepID=A0A165A421_9CRUS|nr:Uncharacterized protein APZ42_016737 [Daphnia magna]
MRSLRPCGKAFRSPSSTHTKKATVGKQLQDLCLKRMSFNIFWGLCDSFRYRSGARQNWAYSRVGFGNAFKGRKGLLIEATFPCEACQVF